MLYRRKKVIVFSFEGKNNQTEHNYFSHFLPANSDFIFHSFSSGVTDPEGMIKSTKQKRKKYDYHAKEDCTYLFIDADSNKEKFLSLQRYAQRQGKDFHIIITNPCFELWFLNHFVKTTKPFSNIEIIAELRKHISNYQKNKDIFPHLNGNESKAIENSRFQKENGDGENPFTDVDGLFSGEILVEKP